MNIEDFKKLLEEADNNLKILCEAFNKKFEEHNDNVKNSL